MFHSWDDVRREARARQPLSKVVAEMGLAPDKGRKYTHCPFCQKKNSAGLFTIEGTELFKCHASGCPTDNKALDEQRFLEARGVTGAFWEWVRSAGLDEKEVRKAASHFMGGKGARISNSRSDISENKSAPESAVPPEVELPAEPERAPDPEVDFDSLPATKPVPGVEHPDEDGGKVGTAGAPSLPDAVGTARTPSLPDKIGTAGTPSLPDETGTARTPSLPGEIGTAGTPSLSDAVAPDNFTASADGTLPVAEAGFHPPGVSPSLVASSDQPQSGGPSFPPAEPEPGELLDSPLGALREFYAASAPVPSARQAAEALKRGLTAEQFDWSGYRLSCAANEAALNKLATRYTRGTLVRAGLYTVAKGKTVETATPSQKYYGLGVAGKSRMANGESKLVRDWNEPILLPYFDEQGEVVALRPHKDFVGGQRVQPYFARPSRAWRDAHPDELRKAAGHRVRYAVITEGEFKAAALAQVLWPEVEVAAIPGITNAKNWYVMEPLMDWLAAMAPRMADGFRVIVAYDNEEKGDVNLPGFKEDPWDRFDAVVWARYLCERLRKAAYDARVAALPVAWRDAGGKADWDGALARLVAEKMGKVLGVADKSGTARTPSLPDKAGTAGTPSLPDKAGTAGTPSLPDKAGTARTASLPDKVGPAGTPSLPDKAGTAGTPSLPGKVGTPSLLSVDAAWPKVKRAIRHEFMAVLHDAQPSGRAMELFGDHEVIDRKLAHISYEPKIVQGRTGGPDESDEADMARRIREVVSEHRRRAGLRKREVELKGPERYTFGVDEGRVLSSLLALADAYEAVQGRLYALKPPIKGKGDSPKSMGEPTLGNWLFRLEAAKTYQDAVTAWVCSAAIKGTPEPLSDFTYKAHFILRKGTGQQDRYIEFFNIHGPGGRGDRSGVVAMPGDALSTSVRFRDWAPHVRGGGYTWSGGDKFFQDLLEDWAHAFARRTVEEVGWHGWHEGSRVWFFSDCAFDFSGSTPRLLRADKQDCYWVNREGYKLARDADNDFVDCDTPPQKMHHKAVSMRPRQVVRMRPGPEPEFELATLPEGEDFTTGQDASVVRELFREIRRRLNEILTPYDGDIALAMMLMTLAGPEIYSRYSFISGLWLHGEKGQGKSAIARWLMYLLGYSVDTGISLGSGTSSTGMHIAAQQYCYQPIWLEEFRAQVSDVEDFLRVLFDRGGGAKKIVPRKLRAVPLVTGEASAHDAACRSRFPQILVSKSQRKKLADGSEVNHYEWFQSHRRLFFVVTRHLMWHRKQFSTALLKHLDEWMKDPMQADYEDRSRFVYGTAWSSIAAVDEVLELGGGFDTRYAAHLMMRCGEATDENRARVFLDQFLQDVINAMTRQLFGQTPDEVARYFKAELVDTHAHEDPRHPDRAPWVSWRLWFAPGPVIDIVREMKRRGGQDMVLDIGDLQSQMSARPWWVRGTGGSTVKSLRGVGNTWKSARCWGLELDKLPEYGYVEVSSTDVARSEAQAATDSSGQTPLASGLSEVPLFDRTAHDPRLGPLYGIVAALHPNAVRRADGKVDLRKPSDDR